MCIYIYIQIHVYLYFCIHIYIYNYIIIYIYTYTCTYIYVYTYTWYTYYMYIYIYVCIDIYTSVDVYLLVVAHEFDDSMLILFDVNHLRSTCGSFHWACAMQCRTKQHKGWLWPWHKLTELRWTEHPAPSFLSLAKWLSFQKKASDLCSKRWTWVTVHCRYHFAIWCLFPRRLALLQANMKMGFKNTHTSLIFPSKWTFPIAMCTQPNNDWKLHHGSQLLRWMLGHRTAMLNCKICPRPRTFRCERESFWQGKSGRKP